MSPLELLAVTLAAGAAGMINAVAGGGTLISFPTLTAVGVPTVDANITNTVALCPGYLGGTHAQRADLVGEGPLLRFLLPAAALGGLTGGVLLLLTSESLFRSLVPWLILLSCLLLALQERVRRFVTARRPPTGDGDPGAGSVAGTAVVVFFGSIYGGYFGGGLGIVLLAVLGLFLPRDLRELNAIKQAIALVVNVSAALFLVFSGRVVWAAAAVMAVGALAGGNLGGRVATRIPQRALRWTVITIGVAIAIVYFVR